MITEDGIDTGVQLPGADVDTQLALRELADLVTKSQQQCLRGPGLLRVLDCTLNVVCRLPAADASDHHLSVLLRAIWEEVDVQDYPRKSIMQSCQLFLHPTVVNLCATSVSLAEIVAHFVLDLTTLSQNKTYAFVAFAEALYCNTLTSSNITSLPIGECIVAFARTPPVTRSEFLLEAAVAGRLARQIPSRTYKAYYGRSESHGFACFFDMLNRLPQTPAFDEIVQTSIQRILEPWITQKQPVPMVSKWKSSVQLQVLLLLVEYRLKSQTAPDTDELLLTLYGLLELEPLPRLRYLLQWIITRIHMERPQVRHDILAILDEHDLFANPKYGAAVMQIARALACVEDADESFAARFLAQLIPLSASPKIILRHEAHWTFPVIFDHVRRRSWSRLLENPAYTALDAHIRALEAYKNPPPQRLYETFNPETQHNLSTLLEGNYLLIEPSERRRVTGADLLSLREQEFSSSGAPGRMPLGVSTKPFLAADTASTAISPGPPLANNTAIIPLQTKSYAWHDQALFSPNSTDPSAATPSPNRKRDIIVVASLIDNGFNLGGLSRTGEIFGIKLLQVRSLKVLRQKDFTSVSVSSEGHLAIEELGEDDVVQYIAQRRLEGYTAIGVEQTDSSKMLGRPGWDMPERVVLVMGSEREGISADVLAAVDFCVEIKQSGQTRSLNVQTAAAVVLYEYSRQHP